MRDVQAPREGSSTATLQSDPVFELHDVRHLSTVLHVVKSTVLHHAVTDAAPNCGMKCIGEIRRQRLRALLDEKNLSLADLSEKLGRTRRDATLSQLLSAAPNTRTGRPREMGSDQARDIERAMGLAEGWMDRDPDFDQALADLSQLRAAEPAVVYRIDGLGTADLTRRLKALPAPELRDIAESMATLVQQAERRLGRAPDAANEAPG